MEKRKTVVRRMPRTILRSRQPSLRLLLRIGLP
uniref:Uncharacterized protein n=1 Tax=Romanomermis culicivorax TaxID=13658 RepID=A0A915I157_ROMCU